MMFATKYLLLQSLYGHETTIHHCPDYCFFTQLYYCFALVMHKLTKNKQISEPVNGTS